MLTQSGTYTLSLDGNGARPACSTSWSRTRCSTSSPLAFNTPVTATIANPGDEYDYTFSGSPGQQIYYDAATVQVASQQVQLFDPFGNRLFSSNWSNDQGPLTLTQSGTYTLILYGNGPATGTFDFRVLNAAGQPAVTLGATTSGTLSPGISARDLPGQRHRRPAAAVP